MKNWVKRGVALLLAVLLAVPCVNVGTAQAATKATLSDSKMTIGIGSSWGPDEDGIIGDRKNELTVYNAVKGASYSFTSSNKKVVTVKKKGTVGYLTGVAAGSAKITVKQTLNKKTTTVGSCKVTVKKSSLSKGPEGNYLVVGGDTYLMGTRSIIMINNMIFGASYEFICSDENFSMELVEKNFEGVKGAKTLYQKYTAKKPGTYKVTVKETYKKKTRKVGTIALTVEELSIPETMTLLLQKETLLDYSFRGFTLGSWIDSDCILYEVGDPEIAAIEEREDDYGVKCEALVPKGVGTTSLTYYYKEKNGSKGALLGSSTLEVIDPHVTGISCSTDTLKGDVSDWGEDIPFNLNYDIEGDFDYYFRDGITVTSSDPSVAEAELSGWEGTLYITYKAAGTAVITISYGEFSHSITVTVTDDEDD